MKTWPTLYKKTNTGAIQQWEIAVLPRPLGGTISVAHGQIGGALQVGEEQITEGKNIGKANETTPYQQALAEAEAKWTKKKKSGYVDSIEAARAGEVDAVIEGGFLPMLAPPEIYPHHARHLTWPIYVQPKLDGQRCLAIVEGGRCTLWTRTRKPIRSVPHVAAAYESLCSSGSHIFDGELYVHDPVGMTFEDLMSLVRKDHPSPGVEIVQHNVYDKPSVDGPFSARLFGLVDLHHARHPSIVTVPTYTANNHDELMTIHERHVAEGFEGTMLRNDGPYESGKRSKHLQKLKNALEEEFEIVGVEEGRGKAVGGVGAFQCVTKDGKPFNCTPKMSYARRAELLAHPEHWQGKKLTVVFQNWTADGVPRCLRGKAIRDYD